MLTKKDILNWIDQNQEDYTRMSDEIWENPEIALKEFKASKLQADYLEAQGFKITWGSGGMPTAFIAEWGKGKPIIGILGEYDALKNLSQKKQPTQEPAIPGGLGHGCGHNLMGVGCMAAALGVKRWLETNKRKGTIRYYGCPAEEILAGKVYMAREGAFDDLDAAFNFHPSITNSVSYGSAVGLNNLKFRFHGITAHAGGAPHLGRSALDAVELMNVGVNYLREHVETSTRIHYVITHGGDLPNIVPSEAEVWYFVRAPERSLVDEVTDRVRKIAQGAAMMTETTCEEIFHAGCYPVLPNYYLADLQYKNMQEIGPIHFSDSEKAYAKTIRDAFPREVTHNIFAELHLPAEMEDEPLYGDNYPATDEGEVGGGSTDIGDVSWITPISAISTATCTLVPGHNWSWVATCGMSIGHKGMMHAAKIMAASAIDLYEDPEHIRKVREEFKKATAGKPYKSPLPKNAVLPG